MHLSISDTIATTLAETVTATMTATMTVVVEDLSGLAAMRARLAAMFDDHAVDRDVAADVQVATTELVTNGLTHAAAPAVAVRASVDGDRIEMNVHHADRARPRPTQVRRPLDPGGRGLGIVEGVSDGVTVESSPGFRSTALVFERTRPGAPRFAV